MPDPGGIETLVYDGEAAVIANLRSQGYIPLAVEAGTRKMGGRRYFSFEMPNRRISPWLMRTNGAKSL